jgi:hypothetical protein
MKISIQQISAVTILFILFIFMQAGGAQAQSTCIRAWVNGQQLYGVTSFNPITYSNNYCIDNYNAIGYVNYNAYPPDDPSVYFHSAVTVDTVDNFMVSENDCEFYYESPAESSWGGFTGGNDGTINFYFATNSSTMAYGTGVVYFTVTDDNAYWANVSGGHLCYPGNWLADNNCDAKSSLLLPPPRATINIYDKEGRRRNTVLPLY